MAALQLEVAVAGGRLQLFGQDASGLRRAAQLTAYAVERTADGRALLHACEAARGPGAGAGVREVHVPAACRAAVLHLVSPWLQGVAIDVVGDRLALRGRVVDVAVAQAYLIVVATALPRLLHRVLAAAPPERPRLAEPAALTLLAGVRGGTLQVFGADASGRLQPAGLRPMLVVPGAGTRRLQPLQAPCTAAYSVGAAAPHLLAAALRLLPCAEDVAVTAEGAVAHVRAAQPAALTALASVLRYCAELQVALTYAGLLAASGAQSSV